MARSASKQNERRVRRRELLAGGALLGTAAALASRIALGQAGALIRKAEAGELTAAGYDLIRPENILYSVCQQCN
ncbi:MAG: hypothetical protein HY660_18530, partial [Armatimonadetes bacterium]|nr:hypothetical protein [Armatimonadota bacterium]